MHGKRIGLVALFSACFVVSGCKDQSLYQPAPPAPVTTTQPEIQTVPIFLEENGQTEAVEQAVVRARVRGIVEQIPQDAAQVKKGETLFVIEQKEFVAAVNAATAAVNSAKAAKQSANADVQVADARISAADAEIEVTQAEFNRLEGLFNQNAIAKAELETSKAKRETALAAKEGALAGKASAEAEVANAEAALDKANAELEQAQLNLDWTTVEAPIDGRITRTMVKQGNLVENGAEMIEIVRNDRIWANFNISERFLLNLEREAKGEGDQQIKPNTIPVSLKRSGDPDFTFHGFLDYADPRVDQDTGTLQLRAVFEIDQSQSLLLPGLYVRVQIQIGTYEDAMLVPERAIVRDPSGTFVYVVDADSKAQRKVVELGTKYKDMIVIESGIEKTDQVVVDGVQRLRVGAEVDPG